MENPTCYNLKFLGAPKSVPATYQATSRRQPQQGPAHYRLVMAKRCELCGKGPVVGRNISHAHNVTARRFEPNLLRVRALDNGGIRRVRVCTRCLRSNKVVKAA